MRRQTLPALLLTLPLAACNPSDRAGPVASRDLPAPPAQFTADPGIPPITGGRSWEVMAGEQRAAAMRERRTRLGFVEWYRRVMRDYAAGR